ncbi:hypothetical protein CCACVL1_17524 [Corchorus capsularis]|uniref:Uncharacterized protein n=1 Tax=Corchorus capsularis TaxID=210143 RepID=A0A1R3HRI5_COCAP|nr:hypothetical protein CCACVL1_17524 [Corchorus capsularis]
MDIVSNKICCLFTTATDSSSAAAAGIRVESLDGEVAFGEPIDSDDG